MSKLIALFILVLTLPVFSGTDRLSQPAPSETTLNRLSQLAHSNASLTYTAFSNDGQLVFSGPLSKQAMAQLQEATDVAYITTQATAHAKSRRVAASASSWLLGNGLDQTKAVVVANNSSQSDAIYLHAINSDGMSEKAWLLSDAIAPNSRRFLPLDQLEGLSAYSDSHRFRITSTLKLAVDLYAPEGSHRGLYKKAGDSKPLSKSESTRDEYGVWFIRGGSLYDAIEMMGYNISVDRLWQLELYRRTGTGRLAEIFGAGLASQDVQVRMSGYSKAELDQYFSESTQETKDMIQGYADGVNRRIAEVNSNPLLLPFEYLALGATQVEPWTTADVMAWTALLQRNFSSLGNLGFSQVDNALTFLELVETNPPFEAAAKFTDLVWKNDPAAPTMIPAGFAKDRLEYDIKEQQALDALVEAAKNLKQSKTSQIDSFRAFVSNYEATYEQNVALLKDIGAFVKGGSYAWVVSGDLTASGNPILYSGPQMGFSAPSICVEGSIQTEALTISGMTVPGVPTMIIGRTPHHAWSMQVGHTNTWDWYVNNPAEVSLHHMETIYVAGGDPIEVPIYRSPHGPVMAQEPFILSWKYVSWGREWDIANGSLAMARAQSMDDFGTAVSNMAVTQHYCYADRDGNIAYWMGGRRPMRPQGEYRLPQGLLGSRLEWDADLYYPPYHDANTPVGFYGGWNNKASVDADDTGGNYLYGQFHRAQVIQNNLGIMDNVSFEQVRDLAVDIAATDSFGSGGNIWLNVADSFNEIVHASPNESRLAALDILNAWDGHYVNGGPENWVAGMDVADGWVLSNAWINKILDYSFDDDNITSSSLRRYNMFLREVNTDVGRRNNYRKWLRNAHDASAPQTMEDIVLTALDDVLAEMPEQPWGTNQRGYIRYPHAFLPIDLPPTPFGSRSTYAHIVEMGGDGPVRIESMFPLGESGHISIDEQGQPVFDPHFFSMKPVFDGFAPRSFPLFDE